MSVARGFPNAGHFYSNLVKPIEIDMQFAVTPTNGLGVTSVKSNGYVRNVFMHTTVAPTSSDGYLNPNPLAGYALIQLTNNFNKFINEFSSFVAPVTGAALPISGVLVLGTPYVIDTVGVTPAARYSVTTIADVAGASAGKYFTATDVFGNNYVFYNVVAGVGTPPALVGVLAGYTAIPVPYASGALAAAVATALSAVLNAVNGGNSFTTTVVGAVVTVINDGPVGLQFPLAANPQTSGFTIGAVVYTTIAADWQSVGLPLGLTPAVGQSFIATSVGGAVGTGTVKAVGVSGVATLEIVGDPTTSINSANIAENGGAWVMVKFLTGAGAVAAPAATTVVNLTLKFDGSNVTVDGL